MTRHILTDEADRLAHQMAEQTGESLDEIVTRALRAEAERTLQKAPTQESQANPRTVEEKLALMRELQRRSAALPILDPRSPDDMLYDEHGLPK